MLLSTIINFDTAFSLQFLSITLTILRKKGYILLLLHHSILWCKTSTEFQTILSLYWTPYQNIAILKGKNWFFVSTSNISKTKINSEISMSRCTRHSFSVIANQIIKTSFWLKNCVNRWVLFFMKNYCTWYFR